MPRGLKFGVDLNSDAGRLALRRVENLGEDPRPLLETAGIIFEASTRHRFDRSVGPGGVPWVPSRRVRAAAGPSGDKIGPNQGGKTLVDKGNLLAAVRYEVQGKSVLIGVDGFSESAKNAAAHQFGSHRQTVVIRHTRVQRSAFGVPLPTPRIVSVRGHARMTNLPARPFLGIDAQDRHDVIEAWQGQLRALFGK